MSVSPATYVARRRPDRFTYRARTNPAIIAARHTNASGGRLVMIPNPPRSASFACANDQAQTRASAAIRTRWLITCREDPAASMSPRTPRPWIAPRGSRPPTAASIEALHFRKSRVRVPASIRLRPGTQGAALAAPWRGRGSSVRILRVRLSGEAGAEYQRGREHPNLPQPEVASIRPKVRPAVATYRPST